MVDPVSIAISVFSLAISGTTLWFTLLRRGRLAMTTPSIVFFGYDPTPRPTAKVFLRTLLYSTSVKGKVVETMYVRLRQDSHTTTFGFWGYGESEKLSPGSGLYVGQTGIAANHHFVLSPANAEYEFRQGRYEIDVFARIVGRSLPVKLASITIDLSSENATLLSIKYGVLFELQPDERRYIGYARKDPT